MSDLAAILQRMAAQQPPQMTMQPIPGMSQTGSSLTLADVIKKYQGGQMNGANPPGTPPAPAAPGAGATASAMAAAPGGGKGGALNEIAQHIGES